jgi:hypothetical protein
MHRASRTNAASVVDPGWRALALAGIVAALLAFTGGLVPARRAAANPAQIWVVNEYVANAIAAQSGGSFACTAASADTNLALLDAIETASAHQINSDTAHAGRPCIIVRTDGSTTNIALNGRGLVCATACTGLATIVPSAGANGAFATDEITGNGTFTSGNVVSAVQDSVVIDSSALSLAAQAHNITLFAPKNTVQEGATVCPLAANPAIPANGVATATYTDINGTPLVGYQPTFTTSNAGVFAIGTGAGAINATSQQATSMLQPDGTTVAAADAYCGVSTGVATLGATSAAGEIIGVAGAVTRTVDITVTGVAATIDLSASPAALVCDGTARSTVTATVKDGAGNNVVDGTPVNFSVVSLGTANPVNAVTSGGVATSEITPLGGNNSGVAVNVTSGAAAASIAITCEPPGPDEIAGAIVIDHLPYSATVDTTGFSTEAGETLPCGIGATAWFKITLPTAAPALTVDTTADSFSTVVAAYGTAVLSPPGALSLLGCDTSPAGSSVAFVPSGSGTFYIQVGGAAGANGFITLHVNCTRDLDCDDLSDADEATYGTSASIADSDGDGISDGVEVHIYGSNPLSTDTDADGCGDGKEIPLGLDPTDQWDFYSVPVPALINASNPAGEKADKIVAAGDAQAVFAYFKVAAHSGTTAYEQDLNGNGIADGLEYDRKNAGSPRSGAPDGAISAADAQLAFAQFNAGYAC